MRFLSSPSWLLIIGLTGCTADPASQALEDAFHQIRAERSSSHTTSELNPNFRYLRVQIGNREVFMALGYVDKDSDGPIEVWYSGTGEVLRLRDGRLIGATMSIGTDWLSVSFTHLQTQAQCSSEDLLHLIATRKIFVTALTPISELFITKPISGVTHGLNYFSTWFNFALWGADRHRHPIR